MSNHRPIRDSGWGTGGHSAARTAPPALLYITSIPGERSRGVVLSCGSVFNLGFPLAAQIASQPSGVLHALVMTQLRCNLIAKKCKRAVRRKNRLRSPRKVRTGSRCSCSLGDVATPPRAHAVCGRTSLRRTQSRRSSTYDLRQRTPRTRPPRPQTWRRRPAVSVGFSCWLDACRVAPFPPIDTAITLRRSKHRSHRGWHPRLFYRVNWCPIKRERSVAGHVNWRR
jgi:hypothetical protein